MLGTMIGVGMRAAASAQAQAAPADHPTYQRPRDTAQPKAPPPKATPQAPPVIDHAVTASLQAKVAELQAAIERKEQRIKNLETAHLLSDKILKRADDTIAELRKQVREQQPAVTSAQYRNLQFCLHPDRVASLRDDELTARYTAAFRWLGEQAPT
jgi:hypothetical protein